MFGFFNRCRAPVEKFRAPPLTPTMSILLGPNRNTESYATEVTLPLETASTMSMCCGHTEGYATLPLPPDAVRT